MIAYILRGYTDKTASDGSRKQEVQILQDQPSFLQLPSACNFLTKKFAPLHDILNNTF